MSKLLALAAASLLLAACSNADGTMPRLGPAGSLDAGPASFNGGYAGTNGGFSNLSTKSAAF